MVSWSIIWTTSALSQRPATWEVDPLLPEICRTRSCATTFREKARSTIFSTILRWDWFLKDTPRHLHDLIVSSHALAPRCVAQAPSSHLRRQDPTPPWSRSSVPCCRSGELLQVNLLTSRAPAPLFPLQLSEWSGNPTFAVYFEFLLCSVRSHPLSPPRHSKREALALGRPARLVFFFWKHIFCVHSFPKKSHHIVPRQSQQKGPGHKHFMEIQRPPEVGLRKRISPIRKMRDGQCLLNELTDNSSSGR